MENIASFSILVKFLTDINFYLFGAANLLTPAAVRIEPSVKKAKKIFSSAFPVPPNAVAPKTWPVTGGGVGAPPSSKATQFRPDASK
ncbi:hypothetical protein A2597_00330 [Candidatus Woesebacteria bacterium RIFOXYD1_FULL_46_19]|uniref:Uncharacterized protein n=1 Tax=Candidatus Woesebacteria bacterium RIFOXYD1_FULL_46_19 TaxID=1802552 RepID=A0A1F8DLW8_9BACT|nr:MAG: hypothetical protein A2597_00330 [Candidatus Woesebacteria bacterium RIFOXYD1_FULL_46_19]